MKRIRYCLVLSVLLTSVTSFAVELGEMTFESRFSDPFSASIQVSNIENISEENLSVRVADIEMWNTLGIARSSYINDVVMDISSNSDGSAVIDVSSNRSLEEPYLDLLVELSWPSGTIIKHYIALIPIGVDDQIDDSAIAGIQNRFVASEITGEFESEFQEDSGQTNSVRVNRVEADGNGAAIDERTALAPLPANSPQNNNISRQTSEVPEYDRLYITKANETLESIAAQLDGSELSVSERADVLFEYNFYVASRVQVIPAGVSIEIPQRNEFQANAETLISYAENLIFTDQIDTDNGSNNVSGNASDPVYVGEVETSIARFTPTQRAETRVRALGFADIQSRLSGEPVNQVVTAAGLTTVLDRLVAEQGLSTSIEGNLEIVELVEGVRRIDETISEYRARLSEVESRTEIQGRSLESLGLSSGVEIYPSTFTGESNFLWSLLNMIFIVLFILCLVFIWILFKRPEYLSRVGFTLPVALRQYLPAEDLPSENSIPKRNTIEDEKPSMRRSATVKTKTDANLPSPAVDTPKQAKALGDKKPGANKAEVKVYETDSKASRSDTNIGKSSVVDSKAKPESIDERVELGDLPSGAKSTDDLQKEKPSSDKAKSINFTLDGDLLKDIEDKESVQNEANEVARQQENLSVVDTVDKFSELELENFNASKAKMGKKKKKADEVDSINSKPSEILSESESSQLLSDQDLESLDNEIRAELPEESIQESSDSLNIDYELQEEHLDKGTVEDIKDHVLAYTDDVTTFTKENPMQVLSLIDEKVQLLSSPNQELALFYLNIDDFETYESELGIADAENLSLAVLHEVWDYLSSNSAQVILLNRFRQKCFVFMAPFDEGTLAYASALVEDIQSRPIDAKRGTFFVNISSVIVPMDSTFESASASVSAAQNLVQEMLNKEGSDSAFNVRLYEPNLNELMSDDALTSVGRRLLKNNSFNPVYKSIAGLKTNVVDSHLFEAFLQPDNSIMEGDYPINLLDRLRNSKLALELDTYLLNSCCIQLGMNSRNVERAKVMINLSTKTLIMPNFVEWFLGVVNRFNIHPSSFIVQVEEYEASKQMIKLMKLQKELADVGMGMSMSKVNFEYIPSKTIEKLQLNYFKLHPVTSQKIYSSGNNRANIDMREKALTTLKQVLTCAQASSAYVIATEVDQAKLLPKLWQLGVNFIEGSYVASESSNMNFANSLIVDEPN